MFGEELPSLLTEIPGPRSAALAETLSQVECPALTARRARRKEASGASHDPISWQSARGANVRDVDGNVFVDLTAGFGAAMFGHAHPSVVKALSIQQENLLHALGDVHPSDTKVQLLKELARRAPFPAARVILGLSGADAIEAALKTAVLYTRRPGVIAFEGGYHGLSHGPLAACGYSEGFRAPFQAQLNQHVAFARFPRHADELEACLESVARAFATLPENVGALLVEPIQGRGGVHVPPAGFLQELSEICKQQGALLIVDEIYTGLGRTGPTWLHLEMGAEADLICLGKALGGGVAISACLGREEVMRAWGDPGGEAIHTSTFLGNPPACAAALSVLAEFERMDVGARAVERGERMRRAIERVPGVAVRGRGLLLGVELTKVEAEANPARVLWLTRALLEKGFITSPGGSPPSVLCLTPPLCITDAQIDAFAQALAECLS
ncbi:MAG: aspartate aminotransferase family protein [Myxococcales bacterium]